MFKTSVLQNHQLILYFKKYCYFLCMLALPAGVCVYLLHASFPQPPEEDIGSVLSKTEITGDYKTPCKHWESSPGPLEQHRVLFFFPL